MSFQKLKYISYRVGGWRRSSTTNIVRDICFNEKIRKEVKFLIDQFSFCNRKISVTVCDNKIAAEGLSDLVKSSGKNSVEAGQKLAKIYYKTQIMLWTFQQIPLQLGILRMYYKACPS